MTINKEHFLEIKIAQPGRITGKYQVSDLDTLRLDQIIYPQSELPFDVGILPASLTPLDEPLTVIVFGSLSHPLNTLIEARLVGALERSGHGFPLLLAIPVADERLSRLDLDSLPADWRAGILATLQSVRPGNWQWRTIAEIEPVLHECALRYRQAKQKDRRIPEPAWVTTHIRPLAASFTEAERYTSAEYTFHELPRHFQHYVSKALASDERILYAARRPVISRGKRNGLFRHETLQAGVLILTNQRLIHLAELIPPDSANIRYGFHIQIGVLERFRGVSLIAIGDNILLRTEWRSRCGVTVIEWEMPAYFRAALDELVSFLKPFRGDDARMAVLVCAKPLAPQVEMQPLHDPAANDPQVLIPINVTFHQFLDNVLATDEQCGTWALIPAWHEQTKSPRALVVTQRRIFLLPDLTLNVPLANINTLEYTSSILESSLAINYIENGTAIQYKLSFPYPAQGAFQECFEMTRRCMAVVPLV
ncbi:MAG: inorganic diphosphatase [Chloroflexota bacterium]